MMYIDMYYNISLVVLTIAIWGLMIAAKYEEYDLNYGLAIYAFIISFIALMLLIILWFTSRDVIISNSYQTIIFILISSPLSLFIFLEVYRRLFGLYFKL